MRRTAVISGYVTTAALFLSLLPTWWYSTPSLRPCIAIAPAVCPPSVSLAKVAGDLELAVGLSALIYIALLTAGLGRRTPRALAWLPLPAVAATALVAYSAVDLPEVSYAPHVGLGAGFFVAAVAVVLMLI